MTTELEPVDLAQYIRAIPDFPKPGILFKDITPLLAAPDAFRHAVSRLAERYRGRGVDAVAAAEARGFLFAAPLALELHKPLVPLRKPGKLPHKTHSLRYELEYGSAELQVHIDAVSPGARVLLGIGPLRPHKCFRDAVWALDILQYGYQDVQLVLVGDGEWVDLGSTNFTRLSHGGYEEVDVFCRDRMFARRVEQAIEHELRAGAPAQLPLDYRLWRLAFELGVSAFQGRKKAR